MYFVYVIQSLTNPEKTYIGCTEDLKKRLSNHNAGSSSHTSKYVPWKLIVHLVFEDKFTAFEFEKYLKSGSGRAFIKKRFIIPSTI